jgi:uncharacterized protein (TIGR04255 family)
MISRPPDLPDFGAPPVTEVALGVQFNTLDRLLAPHLGVIWSEFKDQFPEVEEHPPLDPVFETFADKGSRMPVPRLHLELLTTIPTPRVFFINRQKTELLQVQRDRFHHNWRKVGEGDAYPRFERMLETFENGYRKLESVLAREKLGSIEPNQCEVIYINQVPLPAGQSPFEAFERLFGSFTKALVLGELDAPEDARFLMRYIIRDQTGAPCGRLTVTAEPAWKLDGSNIVQLALVARGKPHSADLAGVRSFLQIGREHIVRAFTELTSQDMHKIWERKQ